MPTTTLFAKFLLHLPLAEQVAVVRRCGIDDLQVMVRERGHVAPDALATELPRAVAALRAAGMAAAYAVVPWSPAELVAQPERLRALADAGIRNVRTGYFRAAADPAAALREARDTMRRLADASLAVGIRAVLQLHHVQLIASPTAAWYVIDGLPPAAIGVKLDPGNQAFEGWESWGHGIGLLGPHLAAVGVKDVAVTRDAARAASDGKGWSRGWAPIDEGMIDWRAGCRALRAAGFDGILSFQPFHHEHDPAALIAALERETAYLRRAWADAAPATAAR